MNRRYYLAISWLFMFLIFHKNFIFFFLKRIENIYELNIPLKERFITVIGNQAKLYNKSIPKAESFSTFRFPMDHLQPFYQS
jgi:hypothetical protein